MDAGELTHMERSRIDPALAIQQHAAYCDALGECGVRVQVLAADDQLPDCAFVEDIAVVLPEVAVLCRPGAQSRRAELETVRSALPADRPLVRIEQPATLDGGDVLVVGRQVFVGQSTRTNEHATRALKDILGAYGYAVSAVPLAGALHLKTACTLLDPTTLLINRTWVEPEVFGSGLKIVEIAEDEPFGANTLRIGERVFVQASCPRTAALIQGLGLRTVSVDIGEFAKAEAGLTCLSLVFI